MGALNLPTLASGQLTPYQTSNDADAALESGVTGALSVDLSGGDHVLTQAEFTRAVYFASTGNAVARILTTPATNRLFAVRNGGSSALSVKTGSTTLAVAAGARAIFYTDGTTNGLVAIVGSSGGSSAPQFSVSVSAAPGASVNDYAPTGWDASTTTRLLVTANAGDTTVTGFDATGVADGACVYVRNQSATDLLKITHLDAGSLLANRVSCPGVDTYVVPPLSGFLLVRVGSVWTIR